MRLDALAVVYLLVGVACAAAALACRRRNEAVRMADAALLLPFWPLYAPFVVMRLMPDRRTTEPALDLGMRTRLQERLAAASERIAAIDRLLAQPQLSAERAAERHRELTRRGDQRAAAAVASRMESIERLERLRDRLASQVSEARELMAQLELQVKVMRLMGGPEERDETAEILTELLDRVEALDTVWRCSSGV